MQDSESKKWIPFRLWPDQRSAGEKILGSRKSIILKARQLGFTWEVLGIGLHELLFDPIATFLIFSADQDLARDLLHQRLRGMHDHLPTWLQGRTVIDNTQHWKLANGSRAMAFSTEGGRSHSGTMALIDEADFQDLDARMRDVEPTVDAGGRLIIGSTVDKSKPQSGYKKLYLAAQAGLNSYTPIFLPWHSRPGRTAEWYAEKRRDVLARTGALDDLFQEYPASPDEALAHRSLDKRIPYTWLKQCYVPREPLTDEWLRRELPKMGIELPPAIPGLRIYAIPLRRKYVQRLDEWEPGARYVAGGDSAEGNPTSDDSAAEFLNVANGEQVAELVGKHEPATFASYIHLVAKWYNDAAVMIERNNHGHVLVQWFTEHSDLLLLGGHDGDAGWMSSTKGKALLYATAADAFRSKETLLHSFEALTQFGTIEGNTLRAPEGEMDDRADAYALALCGVVEVVKMFPTNAGRHGPEAVQSGPGWWSGRY